MTSEAALAQLSAAGIEVVPADVPKYHVVTRGEFLALVERTPEGFGRAGAAGLLTSHGMAPLVWRGAEARFVTRGFDEPASCEQVEALRAFQTDLSRILG